MQGYVGAQFQPLCVLLDLDVSPRQLPSANASFDSRMIAVAWLLIFSPQYTIIVEGLR